MSAGVSSLLHWTWATIRADLQRWGPYALGLVAVTLTVAGQVLDLLTFDVQPGRTAALGIQTGTLLGACWVAIAPATLATWRQLGDGTAALFRAGPLGSRGVWWGAWIGRLGVAAALVGLSVLTTSVLNNYRGGGEIGSLPLGATSALALLGTTAWASALTAWTGPLAGALGAVALYAIGQAGLSSPWAAGLPMAVHGDASLGAFVRAALGVLAAVALTEAGHRRATL